MADIDNLKIQQQINAAIAERSRLLSAQTSMISDQVELAVNFCKAMKCDGIDNISERISEIRAGLESAQNAAKGASEGLDGVRGGLDDAAGGAGSLADAIDDVEGSTGGMSSMMDAAMTAMTGGWSKIGSLLGGIPSLLKSIGEGIFNIGKALLGPLAALNDLMMGAASDLANNNEMAEARERVREQYGDLNKGIAKDIVTSQADVSAAFAKAGRSVASVFGTGPGGAAAMLDATLELAKDLGPAINLLGDGFKKSAGPLLVLQKGLGLAGEDLKAMVQNAKAMGEDVTKTLEDVAKISEAMVDKFGGSAKEYAKDIAYMKSQSASFGKMTVAQMAASSVAVRKYGMELKDIVGIGKAFEDFEGAAEKSAQLAQMFGAYVDPIKMMKEEDPAKQFEMLRKSMMQAGQSAETMNKAQIKALATQTGMDENMVRLAFSSKNAGKSLGDIQKESEKAGKKQMSQAEIMEQMGENIKKIVVALDTKATGFFDTLMAGFTKGFTMSAPFRAAIGDMSKALAKVFKVGQELGDLFATAFPGISDILGGLGDRATFVGDEISNVVGFIKDLFRGLKTDPVQAMEMFNKKVLGFIENMFKPGGGPSFIGRLAKGMKDFAKALANIAGGLIKLVADVVKMGVEKLVEWVSKPQELAPNGAQAKSFIEELIDPIWSALQVAIPSLLASIPKLFNVAMATIVPKLLSIGTTALNSVFQQLGSVSLNTLGNTLSQDTKNRIGVGLMAAVNKVGGGPLMAKAAQAIGGPVLGKAVGAAFSGPGVAAIGVAISASKVDKVVGKGMEAKLKSGQLKNAGSAGGAMLATSVVDAVTLGLLSDDTLTKIADSAAGLLDSLLEGIKKFAPKYAEGLSANLMGMFQVFAGFGDFIIGLFSADDKMIKSGLEKFTRGLGNLLLGAWKMALSLLGELLPFLLDVFAKVFKGLAKGIGSLIRVVGIALYEGFIALLKGVFNFATDPKFRSETLAALSDFFSGVGDELLGVLKNLFTSLFGAIYDISIGFVQGLFGDDLFMSLFGDLPNMSGKDVFEMIFSSFGDFTSYIWTQIKQLGSDLMNGLIDGIASMAGALIDAFTAPFKAAWKGVKDFFGISSPSKLAAEAGENVTDGFGKGLDDMPKVAADAGSAAADQLEKSTAAIDPAAMSKAAESLGAFKEIANAVGGIGDTKGLDSITNLITAIASMFSNIPLGSDADVERAPKAMAAIVSGLDSVLTTVGNKLSTVLPQLKTALGGITAAEIEALKPQLEFVTSLMEMVGKFSSAVQENQLTPEQVTALQEAQKNGTIIPDGFDELIKKLGGFIGKLSEEGGLISKFSSLKFDPAAMTAAATFTTDILTLTEKFKDVMSSALDSKSVLESDPGFIFTGLEKLNTSASGFLERGGITNLGATLGTLEKLTAAVGAFKTQYGEGVATYLNAAVADMNELDKVLSKIEINDLDTTIDNMNGKLIVKRQNFEFSHKPVHVTINMQVSFKAESFTKDIFKVAADIVKKEDLPDIGTLSNEKYIESQKR